MNNAVRALLAPVLLIAGAAGCDGGAPTGAGQWVPPPESPVSPPAPSRPPAPTLIEIIPAAGPTKGGTPVTLRGTGFSKTSTVNLDELVVPSTVVVSGVDTMLTFVAPPHFAVRVIVRVRNEDGQETLGNLFAAYTYSTPYSPVTSGRWWGFDRDHNAILLYFDGGRLTSVECYTESTKIYSSRHVFLPALVVEDGQFAFTGSDGFGITGIITSATTAVGTISLQPCTGGNWIANHYPA